jgi:hypothetical protein
MGERLTELKVSTSHSIRIVCRVLVLTGLVVFIIAIFCPFLTGVAYNSLKFPEVIIGSVRFWSFLREFSYSPNNWVLRSGLYIQTDWFAGYWGSMFRTPGMVQVWFAGIAVMALFALQIAVLVTGIVAFVRPRSGLVGAPLFLSVFCVLFMGAFSCFVGYYEITYYELGFWLTLVSNVPFALALMISLIGKLHRAKPVLANLQVV